MEAQQTEIRLLEQLRRGNSRAFDQLFRRFYPVLCTYGARFVPMEVAEEIAQDAMLWLWEHRGDDVFRLSPVKYLLKLVYRRALNYLEQEQTKHYADARFYRDIVENVLEETDLCALDELSRRLNEAISRLPELHREAFVMHRFRGMTHKEIATELGVSPQAVNYRIGQAVKQLSADLKDYLPLLFFLLRLP